MSVTFHECELRHIDPDKVPFLDYLHASPECRSYSRNGQSKHQREAANDYQGTSKEAEEANLDLKQFMRILRLSFQRNPKLLFTLENPFNPAGGMHRQRLIIEELEKIPGVQRLKINYCLFEPGVHKTTLIWTNSKLLISAYSNGAFECGAGVRSCCDFRINGRHEVHVTGMADRDSAAFPKALATDLALKINTEAAALVESAEMQEDPEVPEELD